MKDNFLGKFLLRSALLLAAAAGAVLFFDPFFHYHEPVAGLKKVVTKSEYQCIGTIRTFSYDSLIVGSSVAENYNNRWFDQGFGCTTVKAIKSSGTTADFDYYLQEAFENRKLKYVFYSLDISSMLSDPDTNFLSQGMPLYLYDKDPFNDIEYLLNKDVLLESIPYMAGTSYLKDYDEGTSLNWAQYKVFDKAGALGGYVRPESVAEPVKESEYREEIDGNIRLLTEMVQAHPETKFVFFMPPYSMLWWDNLYRTGEYPCYFYGADKALRELLAFENVEIFYFQNDRDVMLNLDNYMDTVHFSQEINHYMVNEMAAGRKKLTLQNYQEQLDDMWELYQQIIWKEIYRYYEEP